MIGVYLCVYRSFSPVLPEGPGWKSPLYLSKIPTCPHILQKFPHFF